METLTDASGVVLLGQDIRSFLDAVVSQSDIWTPPASASAASASAHQLPERCLSRVGRVMPSIQNLSTALRQLHVR